MEETSNVCSPAWWALSLRFALVCVAVSITGRGSRLFGSTLLIDAAQAQSAQQNPLEKARTAVETLINRLRGRDMPEGIVKTNGRIEATQVDVSAKYPGRLAALNVDEGDEVTAGQVVAHHLVAGNRSPAARRAGAGPESQTGAGGSCARISSSARAIWTSPEPIMSARSSWSSTGISRSRSSISGATSSKRRRPHTLRPTPSAIRPRPQSRQPKPMSNGSSRFSSTWCSSRREADACNTGSLAPARWSLQGSAS